MMYNSEIIARLETAREETLNDLRELKAEKLGVDPGKLRFHDMGNCGRHFVVYWNYIDPGHIRDKGTFSVMFTDGILNLGT